MHAVTAFCHDSLYHVSFVPILTVSISIPGDMSEGN